MRAPRPLRFSNHLPVREETGRTGRNVSGAFENDKMSIANRRVRFPGISLRA
jgi:hypothetical protein